MIHLGDCVAVMAGMPAESVDAVVTDPPYGIEFMGREWDRFGDNRQPGDPRLKKSGAGPYDRATVRHGFYSGKTSEALHAFQAWCEAWGREALRVTKPGGYLLAFGGTRTHHRLVCGLEDAGWIIRDELDWIYACLSDNTEILTRRGWLAYNEVSTSDTALAFDSASGTLQWEPIEAVHQYRHTGDMVWLHGAGTDQLVTLNHRLVLVDGPSVDQVSGVRDDVLAALRPPSPVQGPGLLDSLQRDATYPRSTVPAGAVMERRAQGEVLRGDARLEELGMEGRSYRVQEAWELFGSAIRSSAGVGEADGPQGRVHHGAPSTDGGHVRLPDDQGRSRQSREPRSDRQSTGESDALAVEPGSQAVRVEPAGDGWSLVPTTVTAELVDYAGVVWCITVPSGAFVARRNGLAFVTGNSGFPKGRANLKPAHEPIVLARKPGPLRPLNIEETRIGTGGDGRNAGPGGSGFAAGYERGMGRVATELGRWPSNLLLSDPELFDEPNPEVVGSGATAGSVNKDFGQSGYRQGGGDGPSVGLAGSKNAPDSYGDTGGYSRFFAIPQRYNGTCVRCGAVIGAEPSSLPENRPADIAPRPAPTLPVGTQDSMGLGTPEITGRGTTTPAIGTSTSSISSTSTTAIPPSKPLETSPASEPPPSPAKSQDAASSATGTTTTTPSHSMCATCAEAITSPTTSESDDLPPNYPKAFLIPKAGRGDREPVLRPDGHEAGKRFSIHPTMKPVDLMRHLIRLVTPTGGTILDPFLGSGTTGIAAELEGFPWIGIEQDASYVAIAEARLNGTQRGLGLDVPAPTSSYRPPKKMPKPKWTAETPGFTPNAHLGDEEPAA